MIVHQLLSNNTLLSGVYNKLHIVLFGCVVCTLSIARGFHPIVVMW